MLANLLALLLTGVHTVEASFDATHFTTWETPAEPLLPSEDAFYSSKPPELSSFSLGDVIRIRGAPGNLSEMFNASAAYNIVYRTEDSMGQPLWSFTTLLHPHDPSLTCTDSQNGISPGTGCPDNGKKGGALLSYQAAYNTPDVDWSISRLMYDPSQTASLGDVTAALAKGWFVSIPDFEGPYAASTAGSLEGKVVLDGVRAIYRLAEADVDQLQGLKPIGFDAATTKFALWGYSGGAISSGWAGEIQPYYVPDLPGQFAGLVIGGMPPGFSITADLLDGTTSAGLLPNALLGLTQQFPASRDYLVGSPKPEKAQEFLAAANMSFLQAFGAFANQSIFDYFIHGRDSLVSPMLTALYDAHYDLRGKGVPTVPVFAYKAIGDQFSPVELSDELITEYCNGGATVLYERNLVGEHLSEFQNGHSRSLGWLQGVFNGSWTSTGCITRNVSVVDPTGPPLGQQ